MPTADPDALHLTGPQRRVLVAVLTVLAGALVVSSVGSLRDSLIWRPEFELHVQTKQSEMREVHGIVLDILCDRSPTHWRCVDRP